MYYCYNNKEFTNLPRTNREIEYALSQNAFIYYDETTNEFKDSQDNIIDVKGKKIIPSSFIFQLPNMIKALIEQGAIIPNNIEALNKIEEWYNYFETKRLIISFTGSYLHDKEFLQYLYKVFHNKTEVFLKTKKKDFNGIIDLSELFDENSALRKAFTYHEDEEFIISEKVDINEDELGKEEYRIFIYKNRIMNISRITDTTYHRIPIEVIEYVERILEHKNPNFPDTFVIDIFSYQNMYDILELNPFEASGKYLYNTIFSFSQDLTHQDIENIPPEKDQSSVSYSNEEQTIPSTLKLINGTFAKDYEDIKRFGEPIKGYIHVEGLSQDTKIDIKSLLKILTPLKDDSELNNPTTKV
ncbi:MAG: hypothetical protein ACI4XM_08070 [Candidatus Coprovivens sp.]